MGYPQAILHSMLLSVAEPFLLVPTALLGWFIRRRRLVAGVVLAFLRAGPRPVPA
jgi:hypothetical protein